MELCAQHKHCQCMVITDLDGTLLQTGGTFSTTDLATLEDLGQRQISRVIATGRSLYSAQQVLPPDLPIDYLIFSSGAGIIDWCTQELLVAHHLYTEEIAFVSAVLIKHELDFMLHKPVPDNHYFLYWTTGRENPDFIRRCDRYRSFASPFDPASSKIEKACQFVAIDLRRGAGFKYDLIKQQLDTLNVIRSTSPLDGESTWIEIFPSSVSKALAGEWLARKHNISHSTILAIGNDYNDLDLLQWAGISFVVQNAPADLKNLHCVVNSNNEDGFTQAVKIWLEGCLFLP